MISPDNFLQDIAGLGRPDKGLRGLVMHGDIFLDGDVEFRDTAKYTTAQRRGSDVAEEALDKTDIISHEAKYPKAVACFTKDREALTAFYDFPAEHWVHIRTPNPIGSTLAAVRLGTAKTCGCVTRSMLAMVFMLTKSAERRWRRLKGA